MRDFSIDLVWAKLQMAIAAVGGWLGYFVGGVDGLMTALLVLMVMDYVTGIMCAVIDRELSSSVGFRGIFKKVLILMLVGVAHIVDLHVVRSGEAPAQRRDLLLPLQRGRERAGKRGPSGPAHPRKAQGHSGPAARPHRGAGRDGGRRRVTAVS